MTQTKFNHSFKKGQYYEFSLDTVGGGSGYYYSTYSHTRNDGTVVFQRWGVDHVTKVLYDLGKHVVRNYEYDKMTKTNSCPNYPRHQVHPSFK